MEPPGTLEILCAEMGKERKYTGVTKMKMIEHLLKLVSEKRSCTDANFSDRRLRPSPNTDNHVFPKRQRKTDNSSHLIAVTKQGSNGCQNSNDSDIFCKNSACRAPLRLGGTFCKRCSCCICYKYDDNKDPSIWLVCSSDPPHEGESCGFSCHLECAFKDKRAGIRVGGIFQKLDCGFYCVSCKKVNDLLGCCRKQLVIAKEARRLDSLCYRIFLSCKLLNKTEKYIHLKEIVEVAAKMLEKEVGALDSLPTEMARGIVNRLSCGSEVQKLCVIALQSLDSLMASYLQPQPSTEHKGTALESPVCVTVVDISTTSVTLVLKSVEAASLEKAVCFTLWHREVEVDQYPEEPTCTLSASNNQFSITDLSPGTAYMLKIVSSSNGNELGKREENFFTLNCNVKSLSNSSSDGDESKTAGDQWPNNSPQSSEFMHEIPHNGGLAPHVHENRTYSIQVREAFNLETVGSGSVYTLDKTGGPISASYLIIQTESQGGSTNSIEENQDLVVPGPENKNISESVAREDTSVDNESNGNEGEAVQANQSDAVLPSTPCKQEIRKDVLRVTENWSLETEKEPQAGSCSKKRTAVRCQPDNTAREGAVEMDYEYCVKVVRWLECEGHMEKSLREKFLTWFSLRATAQERRIVHVFVETLIDDPPSLAGQLMDTFSEGICNRRPVPAPTGFCMKLWH